MKTKSQNYVSEVLETKEYTIHPLAGDASSRRYYRVVRGETSRVLMEWEPFADTENYPFLNVLNYFAKNQIHVPKIYGCSPELGLVLMEDLGDLTLERRFEETQDKSASLPFYQLAIDELIKIQYHATDADGPCLAKEVEFNVEKFMWEMNYAKKHLFEGFHKIQLDESTSAQLEKIFLHICEKLHAQPKRICHRDYHSRNLMIKLNKMRVIDFQDARLGPIQYDLVSLFKDSYVNIPAELEKTFLEDYCRKVNEAGYPLKLDDEFFDIYHLQTVQRCFKACGSFSSFFNSRGDQRYLKYLPKTIKTVKDTLEFFPEYSLLGTLLDECSES